jgi:hypothetical protein
MAGLKEEVRRKKAFVGRKKQRFLEVSGSWTYPAYLILFTFRL